MKHAVLSLLAMLATVDKKYNTDTKRRYISGISYGGFGTWYMASKHPELFAAAAPVVAWGHPDLMPPIAQAKTPLWVFAAGRDSAEQRFAIAAHERIERPGRTIDNQKVDLSGDL